MMKEMMIETENSYLFVKPVTLVGIATGLVGIGILLGMLILL